MVVASCKKAQNFEKDSQVCAKFSGKVGHEPEDG